MNNNEFIANALNYISRAYMQELTLEQVAENAGFSVSYFNRIFAESTGKTVMEFVREYRLIKAASILRTSDKSILDIALEFGYSNPENFSRAFKTRYGVSPTEYKSQKASQSLTWKESSTSTAVNRFKSAFSQYKEVEIDEFADWLYVQNPIKYASVICFLPQIDCAAFRLNENEFALVEEYRAEEIALSLFCKEENAEQYLTEFKILKNAIITAFCESELENCGYKRIEKRYDYTYLNSSVDFHLTDGVYVRKLNEADEKEVKLFSKATKSPVWSVFEQSQKYGNYEGTAFYGLWQNDKLIACSMPSFDEAYNIKICDIGGIFFLEKYKTKELYLSFWKAVIDDTIKKGYTPVNCGVTADDKDLGALISEEAGYTRTAQKHIFR